MSRSSSSASNSNTNRNATLAKLSPEEYLDRFGVTTYMKDVVTLLLENRPEDCLQFMSNYFSNVVHGSSYMIRSYRYIKLTERNREAFFDNLVAAYHSLNNSPAASQQSSGASGSSSAASIGITANEMSKLIKQVCQDFPQDLFQKVVKVLTQNASTLHTVSFPEFAAAINACLLYEEFIRHAEQWFQSLDPKQTGRIHHVKLTEYLLQHDDLFTSHQIEKVMKMLKIKSMNDGTISFTDLLEALFELSVVQPEIESVR